MRKWSDQATRHHRVASSNAVPMAVERLGAESYGYDQLHRGDPGYWYDGDGSEQPPVEFEHGPGHTVDVTDDPFYNPDSPPEFGVFDPFEGARKTASDDWEQVSSNDWELHTVTGFVGYVEDEGDQINWWIEDWDGNHRDDGWVEGENVDALDQAKRECENVIRNVYVSSRTAKIEKRNNEYFVLVDDNTGEVLAEANRYYAHTDGFGGWVITDNFDRYKTSDPLPNRQMMMDQLKIWNDPTGYEAKRVAAPVGPSNAEKIDAAERMYGTGSPQHEKAKKRFGDGKDPKAKGQNPGGASGTQKRAPDGKFAQRTANSMWDTVEPRHKVAGWNWDNTLEGYVAEGASAHFACVCGSNIEAPSYGACRCGKIWNSYTLSSKEGGIQVICREVPDRGEGVLLASRST